MKLQALKLRKKGYSIKDIAVRLKVSKSSASVWCSDIMLTSAQRSFLAKKAHNAGLKGRMMGAQANKNKKIENIKKYEKIGGKYIGKISKRERTLIAVALYWAEGSKKDGPFSCVNSDPWMIKIIYRWLREDLDVQKKDFVIRVAINLSHKVRIGDVLKFWSNLLDLPREFFKPTSFIKTTQKKVYQNHNTYYGTLILRVRKSTNLKYRMLGLIEGIKTNLSE
ncbi:MAG: helix-turn-helix domain containing protein [Candidatus Pacebacteria bacterium]|nr:helix-turn-helix domain containing protein [Candidatus Paceibacterota bacterium]